MQDTNFNAIQTRLSWLGKERDKESGLGDHGVRKYDNISGRFLSIDPLWEKYLSWTPYQYAGNNPVNAYDVDGREPFHHSEKGSYSDLGLPQKQQQILGGMISIAGGTAGIILSYGALTGPSVGVITGPIGLMMSLYSTTSGTTQAVSALAGNEKAAKFAGSNPGFYIGMAIDGLAGNKKSEVSNITSSLYSLVSIGLTINPKAEGQSIFKGISTSADLFSVVPKLNEKPLQKNNGNDSSSPDRKAVDMKNAPTSSIKFEIMGR